MCVCEHRFQEPIGTDFPLLCLVLLRVGVQFLQQPSPASDSSTTDPPPPAAAAAERDSGAGSNSSVAPAVLSHLCSLVDDTSSKPLVQSLARDTIKEGVVLFFPDAKARKKYLLNMVKVVHVGEQPLSWWLKFEALCSYFIQKDHNSLLELNWDIAKVNNCRAIE